jgi:DNA polymerase III delta subunit
MTDHIGFIKDKRLVPNVIIMAGEEDFPIRAIMEEYKNRIGADKVEVIWADEEENLIEKILERLGGGLMGRNVVLVRNIHTLKGYKNLLRRYVDILRKRKGCAFYIPEKAEEFASLEGGGVLLINMRRLNEEEFKKWLVSKLIWLKSRPDLLQRLQEELRNLGLTEAYNEIVKLKLYSDKPASEALNLLWHLPNEKVYSLGERILSGDIEGAYQVLDSLKEQGEDPILILAYLIRQVEYLTFIKGNFAVEKLPDFIKRKLSRYARWISDGELSLALERLKKADFDMKGKIRGQSQWAYLKILTKDLVKLIGKKPYENIGG